MVHLAERSALEGPTPDDEPRPSFIEVAKKTQACIIDRLTIIDCKKQIWLLAAMGHQSALKMDDLAVDDRWEPKPGSFPRGRWMKGTEQVKSAAHLNSCSCSGLSQGHIILGF